jgi:glycerol-3-phosphate acyltransferase PlsX
MENLFTKLGALFVRKQLIGFKNMLDYREYGGAPLLGTNKPVIKGHGSSDVKAVYSAILQAIKFVDNDVIAEIEKNVEVEENV